MDNEVTDAIVGEEPNRKALLIGLSSSIFLLLLAFGIGIFSHGWTATASVVISGMVLEVVVAAVASIPLGFDPLSGALIAAISNMILAPFLLASFDVIINKSAWLKRKLTRAEKIGDKYGKYGVWILAPLAPFIGVFVGIAVGAALRFRPLNILISLGLGVIIAAFLTTYGGDGIKSLF